MGDGLTADVQGSVTIGSLQADRNGGSGAYITTGAFPVKITTAGTFDNNHTDGLYVWNKAPISLSNLTANSNGVSFGYGATIDNSTASTPQPISLSGTNVFNGNYSGGLDGNSQGAITASNVTANNNLNSSGIGLSNDSPTASGGITLTGTNVANNNALGNGFNLTSVGLITLNNASASGNQDGAWLQNDDNGTSGLTFTGVNSFSGNTFNGIEAYTKGNVNITKGTFDGNGGTGLYLHTSLTSAFTITMTCGSFNTDSWGIALSTTATPIGGINLTGVVFSGNTSGDLDVGPTSVTRTRDCPLP
jgi:hypothetical protein